MPEIQEKVKEKEEEKLEKSQKKLKQFRNKIVIRKLPPNLTLESFLEIVDVKLDDASIVDFYFVPADWSLGAEATTRAYIEFKNESDIFDFTTRFDGYVFVDNLRGSEYPAIVEYAPFQGLVKSRARKRDKHVGTIENEQHFINFLDLLKKTEEAENQKTEVKVEYSYQIKDDKKITSTPLIEYLAAKNQEKRDAKRKKVEERKKQREDEKQKIKIQIAKTWLIPEPIKESKEEVVYDDGVVVRTVPSRLGRNDRRKESKEANMETKTEINKNEKDKDRRDKRDRDGTSPNYRRKPRGKKKKNKDEEIQQKPKETETIQEPSSSYADKKPARVEKKVKEPAKKPGDTKRYSVLRKARQEKENEAGAVGGEKEDEETMQETDKNVDQDKEMNEAAADVKSSKASIDSDEAQSSKVREQKTDERAQRQIRNKDRPSLQRYRPQPRETRKQRKERKRQIVEMFERNEKTLEKENEEKGYQNFDQFMKLLHSSNDEQNVHDDNDDRSSNSTENRKLSLKDDETSRVSEDALKED